jgi:hypothetical protein
VLGEGVGLSDGFRVVGVKEGFIVVGFAVGFAVGFGKLVGLKEGGHSPTGPCVVGNIVGLKEGGHSPTGPVGSKEGAHSPPGVGNEVWDETCGKNKNTIPTVMKTQQSIATIFPCTTTSEEWCSLMWPFTLLGR